ncbi:PREDICTED: hsp70 nucleotide exchange factor FES1-like [Camelina sativa]|uniref:Hsp70 nucleotide exchange factor FES1-like n=1 Tax=Camelina sativa TaxID=90675 RepID=A0ABM0TI78_CAMSA|nr:PREDICTED: hsp70 nucleotide exchange factor FES1-like [Camelina sativa]
MKSNAGKTKMPTINYFRCMLVLVGMSLVVYSIAEKVNSTGGMVWSSARDEAELVEDSGVVIGEQDQIDGGFSSLDGMLHWAIGNSDPATLKEAAKDAEKMSLDELQKRQLELKELVEKLKMPSDAKLMQIAIDDLKNSSLSLEDRHRALQELLILVEPIDNANDLSKSGGLRVVAGELNHDDTEVRKLAAWVLGKASQNNPFVQEQVLEFGALTTLIKMVNSSSVEEAGKALFAVSALIRNNIAGQDKFYAAHGYIMLQDVMRNGSLDIKLRRKAVFLVGDLAESQLQNTEKAELPIFNDRLFLKSVIDLTAVLDLDLQEKALTAIQTLLQLKFSEPQILKEFCGLEGALERMKLQLEESMADEDKRDYAADVESLRGEVELIFRQKLGLL